MKSNKFKIALLFIFTLALFSSVNAKDYEKIIEKEFNINANGTLKIENKYGNIDIENWDKNLVQFVVTITADTNGEAKAEKIFRDIEITFPNEGPGMVHAKTVLSKVRGKFDIHYKVLAPKSLNVIIYNKYGSVNIDEIAGNSYFKIKYGSLKARNIGEKSSKPSEIDIAYSNLNIKKMKDVILNIGYGNCSIDTLGNAKIISKYSKLNFGQTNGASVESKYDRYKFQYIGGLNIESKYTNYKVYKLNGDISFTSKYGDLTVKEITTEVEALKIDNEYGHVDINLSNVSYNLNFETSYCKVRYNGKSASGEDNSGSGIVVGDAPELQIDITSRYGGINLE